ncbi:hypothetical protein ACFO1B_42905 [Dactylosporangium siamense]|uniref:Uncharacterized protein n=1 Tax=Dactylosporangium siamense TaxID=685454 RepID=A0A919UGS5_9ACTN|nr:hypothetical protein [Dactylosporangium siamense]GIG50905.1 hypothetical protein Dsi01nite_089460 [Dactylosporangium siamense]
MGLWLKVHREVTGAWRSACYDVYRQVSRRKLVQLLTDETTEFAARHRARDVPRRPRRVAATSGVALLVAGGAAGTYLAVAGSLTAMRTPPAPPAVAAAAEKAPDVTDPATSAAPQAEPTRARPQVRRSAPPPVLAMPAVPPAGAPTTNRPESTPTPSASPSPSVSTSPSPSVSAPSPTRTASKSPKQGQSNVGVAGR